MASSEKATEKTLKSEVEKRGGLCLKLLPFQFSGLPDRLCLLPGGKIFFAEIKDVKEVPSKLQLKVKKSLEKLGFKVYVVRTIFDIEKIFNKSYFKSSAELKRILKVVSNASGFSTFEISAKDKTQELVNARQAFVILAHKLTDENQANIGAQVNLSHTVVNQIINSKTDFPKAWEIINKTCLLDVNH